MSKSLRSFLGLALALVLAPAAAKHAHRAHLDAVHPAMWTVHGPVGTAYLFGSVHVLPPNIKWKRPEILAAMRRADIFIFEIPLDHQAADRAEAQHLQKEIMDVHGMLPPGESLRGDLPASMVPKYDLALDTLNISPGYVDRLQPWLASMVLETAQFFRSDAGAMNGIDVQVYALASDMHKQTRGFETLEQQLAMIAPEEQNSGIAELGRTIDDANADASSRKFDKLVAAWERGDVSAIEKQSATELTDPQLRKTLLDDRNARWEAELQPMLSEPHTYFITVGAAHLAGPLGLPTLLRKAGYKVDGP